MTQAHIIIAETTKLIYTKSITSFTTSIHKSSVRNYFYSLRTINYILHPIFCQVLLILEVKIGVFLQLNDSDY